MTLPDVAPGAFDNPEARLPRYTARPADPALLDAMRAALGSKHPDWKAVGVQAVLSSFPQVCDRLVLTLYQPGETRLMVARRGQSLADALERALTAVRRHQRIGRFAVADIHRCRIQLDILTAPPVACDVRAIGMEVLGENHFEIGLDGLLLEKGDARHYILPGDAYVHSYMGMQQLRDRVTRLYGDDALDTYAFRRFTSESYVSFGGDWLRLYRGHPLNGPITRARLERAAGLAIDHIIANMRDDGRFLYYYDAAKDSRRDHEHPTRNPDTNPYYNILRHGGGILAGLYHARLTGDDRIMEPVRRAIGFLLDQARPYTTRRGEDAAYIFFNRKAKLGGTGIGLYALGEYRRVSGEATHDAAAHRLARHLVEQITDSGEFIYYKLYLDHEVTEQDNQNHFSFYYPGEALCGLAGYCLHILRDEEEKARILEAVHRALRFLIVERPRTRAEEYRSLPSDAWLMMAIMEFWDVPEFRRDLYRDFVFGDADTMVRQMYTVLDAPYPDYAGAFFYEFGEFPYADGARAEGLMGAFTLAHKVGDQARVELYGNALRLVAWATMHLVNTPESLYFARNPQVALGGIRFKYTRQWFRIDTIQHVAAFYLKLMLDGRVPIPRHEAPVAPALVAAND